MLKRCLRPQLDPDPSGLIYLYLKKEYRVPYVLKKMAYLSEIEVYDNLCKGIVEFETDYSFFRNGLKEL